jgi:hypothetical protein
LIQTVPEDMQQRDDGDAVDDKDKKAKEFVDAKRQNNAAKERVLYTIHHEFKNLSDQEIADLNLQPGNNEGRYEMSILRKAITLIRSVTRGRSVIISVRRPTSKHATNFIEDGRAMHSCMHCSSETVIETFCNKCLCTVCLKHMKQHRKTAICKRETKLCEKGKELMPKLLEPTQLCRRDKCANRVDSKFKKCGNCKQARYCSRECQVADWSDHKTTCYKIGEEVD